MAFEKPKAREGGNYNKLLAELPTEIWTSLVWCPGILSTWFGSKAYQLFEQQFPSWMLHRSGSTSTATVFAAEVKGSHHHLAVCPIHTESLIVNKWRKCQRWKGKHLRLTLQLHFLGLGGCKLEGRQQVLFTGWHLIWMWAKKHPAIRWAGNVLFNEALRLSHSTRHRHYCLAFQ